MKVDRVGPEHRAILESFSCARWDEPWGRTIEEMVREQAADCLELGVVAAMGCWDADALAAVSIWTVQEDGKVWRSNVLAVAAGYRGRGLGLQLKRAVIERARQSGAESVVSTVYWDNGPMLGINRACGASIVPDPEAPEDYRLCTIELVT